MFKLEKERTNSTPYMFVDEESGYMRLLGESFPENVLAFYAELIDWLQEYLKGDFGKFVFDCELKYFNSSTVKLLLNMMLMLDEVSVGNNKVVVNWITTQDNEINIECGEDFQEDVENLEFNIVIRPV